MHWRHLALRVQLLHKVGVALQESLHWQQPKAHAPAPHPIQLPRLTLDVAAEACVVGLAQPPSVTRRAQIRKRVETGVCIGSGGDGEPCTQSGARSVRRLTQACERGDFVRKSTLATAAACASHVAHINLARKRHRKSYVRCQRRGFRAARPRKRRPRRDEEERIPLEAAVVIASEAAVSVPRPQQSIEFSLVVANLRSEARALRPLSDKAHRAARAAHKE